jgi:hypothetical protein
VNVWRRVNGRRPNDSGGLAGKERRPREPDDT